MGKWKEEKKREEKGAVGRLYHGCDSRNGEDVNQERNKGMEGNMKETRKPPKQTTAQWDWGWVTGERITTNSTGGGQTLRSSRFHLV